MKTLWKPILLTIIAILFVCFIYPTRYFYLPTTTSASPDRVGQNYYPVRIDRLTGRTEILLGIVGWVVTTR